MQDSVEISLDEVREILNEIESEATDHNAEYASGMRNARLIAEQNLKSKFREEKQSEQEVAADDD